MIVAPPVIRPEPRVASKLRSEIPSDFASTTKDARLTQAAAKLYGPDPEGDLPAGDEAPALAEAGRRPDRRRAGIARHVERKRSTWTKPNFPTSADEAGVTSTRAWQRMLSGRRLDPLDLSPLDVEITDIAHGLARVARWNGQTAGTTLSVPQHSLMVEDIFRRSYKCSTDDCLMALLHDAPEYVIGDMISPFKAVVGGGYKLVEKRLESAIHLHSGLPAPLRPE